MARRGGRRAAVKSARDKVFEVAADLFYHNGIRAVGVEEIVTRAGVSKISLYRAFASKDALILAYLEQRNAEFWRKWDADFSQYDRDPREQLRAITSFIAQRTIQPGYRGCPFINYCAEFPEASHPGHRVVDANKREMRRRLRQIATRLGAPAAKKLADGLQLLLEGTYAISQTFGGRQGPAPALVAAAESLVAAHLHRGRESGAR